MISFPIPAFIAVASAATAGAVGGATAGLVGGLVGGAGGGGEGAGGGGEVVADLFEVSEGLDGTVHAEYVATDIMEAASEGLDSTVPNEIC